MRCEHCGSEDLSYERDALLVATPLRLEGRSLVLDTAPRPAPLDDVVLSCRSCGREQDGVRWEEWRPDQLPADVSVVEGEDALDLIAAYVNEPGEDPGCGLRRIRLPAAAPDRARGPRRRCLRQPPRRPPGRCTRRPS